MGKAYHEQVMENVKVMVIPDSSPGLSVEDEGGSGSSDKGLWGVHLRGDCIIGIESFTTPPAKRAKVAIWAGRCSHTPPRTNRGFSGQG